MTDCDGLHCKTLLQPFWKQFVKLSVDVFMLPSQLLYTDTLNVHVSVSSFVSRLSVHSPAFIY